MVEITTHIDIDAQPTAVWAVLTDWPRFPQWNPFIQRIDGTPSVGQRLDVRIAPPGGKAMTFRPTVQAADVGRELRWLGRFIAPGVMDGEHRFTLATTATGGTRFTHSERFTGLLAFLMRGDMLRKTRAGFEAMNQALKQQVEAGAGH